MESREVADIFRSVFEIAWKISTLLDKFSKNPKL